MDPCEGWRRVVLGGCSFQKLSYVRPRASPAFARISKLRSIDSSLGGCGGEDSSGPISKAANVRRGPGEALLA